jgi:hypothetical protein
MNYSTKVYLLLRNGQWRYIQATVKGYNMLRYESGPVEEALLAIQINRLGMVRTIKDKNGLRYKMPPLKDIEPFTEKDYRVPPCDLRDLETPKEEFSKNVRHMDISNEI